MSPSKSRTRQLALSAVLAAVYFVLRSIPTFEMVGGGRFTAGDFLLISIALIAGPWSGIMSVFIGTVMAYVVNPPLFFGLDFLPGFTNVIIVSLVLSNRLRFARAVYLAILLAFLISPYSLLFGYVYVPYTWLHIVALAILFSPLASKIRNWVSGSHVWRVAGVAVLSFLGAMAQHLVGGLLFEGIVGYVGGISPLVFKTKFWQFIFFVYPVERLVIVVISTIIAVPLLRSVSRWTTGITPR